MFRNVCSSSRWRVLERWELIANKEIRTVSKKAILIHILAHTHKMNKVHTCQSSNKLFHTQKNTIIKHVVVVVLVAK